ncbi:hypothetical protein LTR56_019873 [Elasticomyces elasticus]|nr:hypothetical protein LTR56_019873 [Elasticomyces elasticus]KAK3642327.1 hypothetical protein LTR22_016141 [Elasticomyces elasticus]KAK4914402.1 hypothetical protein LTR49_017321 [Elasticomyces elasticus]KAK5760378.1 hypothetical protein LTS12_009421 [Elasticomyces elasticus]
MAYVIDITSSPQKLPASSHRLPTVSASDALQELQTAGPETVSTTLPALDILLAGVGTNITGGLGRGKTTEIWGPVGAGKTALLLDSAIEQRTSAMSGIAATQDEIGKYRNNLMHYRVPTLSHLLAMVLHSQPDFPPSGTTTMMIRGLNTLIDIDYPRILFASAGKSTQQKWQAGRRYAVLGSLIAGLNKLAVLNNVAIVATTGCASRTRSDSGLGSALVPGIGGAEWDGGVWNRLVVFRDFHCRFVGVQKSQGRTLIGRQEIGETGKIVAFDVERDRSVRQQGPLSSLPSEGLRKSISRSPAKPRKRYIDEVADSEGEDADEYGWAETDEDALTADTGVDEPTEQTATA